MNALLQAPTLRVVGATRTSATEDERMTEDNEKLVRAFYEATVPGHRESLSGLQSVHVMCEAPEGMSTGGEGMKDRLEHFLFEFCAAVGVHFVAEEFITMDERVVAIGHIKGETEGGAVPIDVPFVHVWTVRDDRLEQLLFFTDTAMLTQALAQQVDWNARSEAPSHKLKPLSKGM
jgi:ketosteroid isomerase-like protein